MRILAVFPLVQIAGVGTVRGAKTFS